MPQTEIDANARAILKTVKDRLRKQGHAGSYSDSIRYMAHELCIGVDEKHLAHETRNKGEGKASVSK